MAANPISPDSVWKLKSDFGVGTGNIPSGSELTVMGVYAPGTPGIGYSDEDTVLATYERPGGPLQTVAIGVADFKKLADRVGA